MTIFPGKIEVIGEELHALAARMFPICRSISGDGVRETLEILRDLVPVESCEVPTGTEVFDWVVPQEWNIRDAYVKDHRGNRVIDFGQSNLHVVNCSRPVHMTMSWSELTPKLHTLPDQPDLVPYVSCFYKDDWGFCLSQNRFDELAAAGDQYYEVVIDSTLSDGSLTYGELVLPGDTGDEVLFSAHICHPALANDNLSGIAVAAMLARSLMTRPQRRYTYRFLFAPATIGAITWLAQNRDRLANIKHGLVLSLLGDKGRFTYKRSRSGRNPVDRAVEHVLATSCDGFEVRDFVPFGYDERQFCSPGIDLAMGCLMRTPNGEFAEYHTSGDNLDFIQPASLARSFETCVRIVDVLENDATCINRFPFGEPRLSKYGLYDSLPADEGRRALQQAVQWVLNLSDGRHSLLDIAIRSGTDFTTIHRAARRLEECGVLSRRDDTTQDFQISKER